ncbi:MAG: hypothetical protein EHM36_05145 [Deltaproteobacteria bacterium]|nr:MAG: hypothetical protein EHM36_05145 [Deltaproteobacteria bacterium]
MKSKFGKEYVIPKGSKVVIHPFARHQDAMTEKEYTELKESIRKYGQLQAVDTFNLAVYDGIHRTRAMGELGLPIRARPFEGTEEEMLIRSFEANVNRRHYTPDVKLKKIALFVVELKKLNPEVFKHGGDRQSQETAGLLNKIDSAVKQTGKSKKHLNRQVKVIEKGSKALNEAVDEGEVSLHDAEEIASLPKKEQNEVIDEKFAAKEAKAKEKAEAKAAAKAAAKERKSEEKERIETHDLIYLSYKAGPSGALLSRIMENPPKRGHLAFIRFSFDDDNFKRAVEIIDTWKLDIRGYVAIKLDKANSGGVSKDDYDLCLIAGNGEIDLKPAERFSNCLDEDTFLKLLKKQEGESNLNLGLADMKGWKKL